MMSIPLTKISFALRVEPRNFVQKAVPSKVSRTSYCSSNNSFLCIYMCGPGGFYSLAFNGEQLSSLVDFHSAPTCQSECQQNAACVGFSFYNQRCVMFRTITSYLVVRKCISGFNSWSSIDVENGLSQRISHPSKWFARMTRLAT